MRRFPAASNVSVMYINAKNELFLQYYPERKQELENFYVGCPVSESLQSGHQAEGEISRITNSGILLKNWRLI